MLDERTREAVRYLGYGRHAIDEKTLDMVHTCFQELETRSGEKSIYRIFECNQKEDGTIQIGNMQIKSRSLERNLRGCQTVLLFGATLGIEVDRMLKQYSHIDMPKAVVLQACAAAYLEEYCDRLQESLGEEMKKEGLWMRPRFSPGYGDFDIRHQKEIMEILELPKKIGLTLTDSYMMTPTKSVTALIGLSKERQDCHKKGCEVCEKTDCPYRRA